MKKHQPSPPKPSSTEKEREQARAPSPPPSPEPLYAKVNKPKKGQQQEASGETVYAPQHYPPQDQPETIYAPQRPIGNPYDRPRAGAPSNGQRAKRLVDPYAVTDMLAPHTGPDAQRLENPLYEGVGGGAGRPPQKPEHLYAELEFGPDDRRSPSKPVESVYATAGMGAQGGPPPQKPEHLYAELEFGPDDRRSPHKPVESVYATVGMGAEGGPDPQKLENPLYEGVGSGRTPTPPRTPKDEITSSLLKDPDFQYSLMEVQERCVTVYGNRHALNGQLAKVLDNPQGADTILWDLAANPETGGKLAGQKVLGVKSPSRREAEEEFKHLCSAFEKHVNVTQKLHKRFTRNLEKDKSRESPERHGHRHHHRHHSQEREGGSPERQAQRRGSQEKQGRAFAM
ncbi:BID domain-containing T4SS effector [Bartonella senegalensis]|uniref:BID domain-containing T4SS effector n=1 Tax=Bartonella senegalensis TaxID=1468418 RepID=UPI0002D47E64|nr:BID domain-containing T4SS effector [Bartonella senegalensis]